MTDIDSAILSPRRPGAGPVKRHSLKTDMTPMVDLGFLLITFFVMTVQLSKPSVVNLNMPKEGTPMPLGDSNALTVLLDRNDEVYYYEGNWEEAIVKSGVIRTNLSGNGLRKIIMDKQYWLDKNSPAEGRDGLMLLIKAGNNASYENVINALDEVMINLVKKYLVLPANEQESAWMKKTN